MYNFVQIYGWVLSNEYEKPQRWINLIRPKIGFVSLQIPLLVKWKCFGKKLSVVVIKQFLNRSFVFFLCRGGFSKHHIVHRKWQIEREISKDYNQFRKVFIPPQICFKFLTRGRESHIWRWIYVYAQQLQITEINSDSQIKTAYKFQKHISRQQLNTYSSKIQKRNTHHFYLADTFGMWACV